jgi:predicted small metal-binding protein
MEKVLRCGVLLAGCQHAVRAATVEDVLRQATKHAAEAHGIKEVTPDLAAKVQSKIRTE